MSAGSTGGRFVLVLAGGRGERFWPWSRPGRPKQLLPLASGGRTLLAATMERARKLVPVDHILVLTSKDLVAAVAAECGPGALVVGEPVGRNTAAAIGAAALWFAGRAADPSFAVMPADHAIDDLPAFRADLDRAFDIAGRDPALVTFGIRPTRPDTGFGYIELGAPMGDRLNRVARFTEKPDAERAAQWLRDGDHVWNSGIFVWRCSVLMNAMEISRPDLARPLSALAGSESPDHFRRGLDQVFPSLPSTSIDYAVLEHAPNTQVIEAGFDWDDLGSWRSWARRQPHDAHGNVLFGDAVALDCDRCIVVGDGGTAAAMGLADMVVVHAGGATLSCRIDDSENVRRVTEAMRERSAV